MRHLTAGILLFATQAAFAAEGGLTGAWKIFDLVAAVTKAETGTAVPGGDTAPTLCLRLEIDGRFTAKFTDRDDTNVVTGRYAVNGDRVTLTPVAAPGVRSRYEPIHLKMTGDRLAFDEDDLRIPLERVAWCD